MPAIDCIITAAGLSSRMGEWKMMLPRQGGTILDASIKNALQFCSRIILVTGYRGNELHQRYANMRNIIIIHNSDYADGLYSSVKAAAAAVESEYCFITHGDMPCLTVEIFNKMWSLRNSCALIPYYHGILDTLFCSPESACSKLSPGHIKICVRHCWRARIIE